MEIKLGAENVPRNIRTDLLSFNLIDKYFCI